MVVNLKSAVKKKAMSLVIGAITSLLPFIIILVLIVPVIGIFFGQGTTFSLPEIVGRGTRISGEFAYSDDDEYEDRVWKWTIKKCREDVGKMQKTSVFKAGFDADEDEKMLAWRKKVMATAVLYDQFMNGHYIVNTDNLDTSDPKPDNDVPWWKEDDINYKKYYAEILGKPEYTSDEWTAFAECFTGDDWTVEGYDVSVDQTWVNLENLLGVQIDEDRQNSIIQCSDIMKDIVRRTYTSVNDAYDDTFKILPWSSEECQAMWDMIFEDHDNNVDVMSAGLWERYPITPSDVGSGPQCTDFASWRAWKEYGHGTAGGNGDQVASILVSKYPDEFELSDTPAPGAIGSGRTADGGIHVFWVEDYDEERQSLTVSDGNYATRNAEGILEYHGICLNRTVTLDALHTTYSVSLNFAVPKIEPEKPDTTDPADPGNPSNTGSSIGSNLQNKY